MTAAPSQSRGVSKLPLRDMCDAPRDSDEVRNSVSPLVLTGSCIPSPCCAA